MKGAMKSNRIAKRYTILALVRDAFRDARLRGHSPFKIPTSDQIHAEIECHNCNRRGFVDTNPLPNEIYIGGEIFALNCNKSK